MRILFMILLFVSGVSNAAVYKCPSNGGYVFMDQPCVGSSIKVRNNSPVYEAAKPAPPPSSFNVQTAPRAVRPVPANGSQPKADKKALTMMLDGEKVFCSHFGQPCTEAEARYYVRKNKECRRWRKSRGLSGPGLCPN